VDGESVTRAARLVTYFKTHTLKVYAVMDADPKVAAARKVLKWIMAHGPKSFARKDAYQGLKGTFAAIEDLDAVLSVLLRHGLIRLRPAPDHPGRGPKPGPSYEVSPYAAAELNCRDYGNCGNPLEESFGTSGAPEEEGKDTSPDSCNSCDSRNSAPVREREPGEEG
jgi:hypothetical protein